MCQKTFALPQKEVFHFRSRLLFSRKVSYQQQLSLWWRLNAVFLGLTLVCVCITGNATEAAAVWALEGREGERGCHTSSSRDTCEVQKLRPMLSPLNLNVDVCRFYDLTCCLCLPSARVCSRRTMMLCWWRCRDLRRSWLKSDRSYKQLLDVRGSAGNWTHCRRRLVGPFSPLRVPSLKSTFDLITTSICKWLYFCFIRFRYLHRCRRRCAESCRRFSLAPVDQRTSRARYQSPWSAGCPNATSAHPTCRRRWPH